MFWADKVALELKKRKLPLEWVDDMKTPSGRVHVGSLLGLVVHDVMYKALLDLGLKAKYTYVFDNHDPMDGLPTYLPKETFEQYMGVPLFKIPSPVAGHDSYASYYAKEFQDTFNAIGCHPEIIWASDLYQSGKMNDGIRTALDNAEKVREVYKELYKKDMAKDWYPFQVYCEQCSKVSTTRVYAWDGKEVAYRCIEDVVDWTKGCGYEGKISPFGGEGKMSGKLPWKIEWAVKWQALGITVEGAGKDHMSRGGSHDFASLICKKVLNYLVPYPLPYEFLLIGGRKMSSSKGVGYAASDMLAILPPVLLRFLMVKKDLTQQTNFDPTEPETIPKLFDEYQKAADAYFTKTDEDLARIFELSQIARPPASSLAGEVGRDGIKLPPTIRFSTLAQWVQMPNMQGEIKKEGLEEWAKYAKYWIEHFAPEKDRFVVQESLPKAVADLSTQQIEYVNKLANLLGVHSAAEELQVALYDLAKDMGLSGKDAFMAIYTAILGKPSGPKAAWLLLSLDQDFVKKRFEEVSGLELSHSGAHHGEIPESQDKKDSITFPQGDYLLRSVALQNDIRVNPEIFYIASEVKEKYPTISIGIAVIKGVRIEKENKELKKEKQALLTLFAGLTTEKLGAYPEIVSYRKLYKDMGIDWHSRRPSPEALLRRVALSKGLYTINTCVDAYNLVVMKHRVSIGAFDLDAIDFPTSLRFPNVGEEILLLGDTEPTLYKPTELAYFDKLGGYNIDFNFRDAQRTAVKESTTNLYINVDGIFDITPRQVEDSLKEACDMIIKYCGGTIETFGIETASH